VEMTEGSVEDITEKEYTSALNYQAAIKAANEKAKQYYTKDLPRMFEDMQQLEKERLSILREYMKKYADIQMDILDPFKALATNLGKKVDTMETENDMSDWVGNIIKLHGPTPELRPFAFDLPYSSEDIKMNRLDPNQTNPDSLFRVTLPHIMDNQKKKHPELDVPFILPTLIKSIRALDGVKAKGIFRISPGKEELVNLRKQFEKGEFDVKADNPHLPAGLMKEWLRELSDPLVPTESYGECIIAVKDSDVPYEQQSKRVLELFTAFPNITQRVIRTIGLLLKDIENNHEENLMTWENLAIVFAPSLLRCPSDDPMELLSNSKFETRFTSVLFKSLSGITTSN